MTVAQTCRRVPESLRDNIINQIKKLFYEHKIEFVSLGGDYLERFNLAKEIIKDKFGIETIW